MFCEECLRKKRYTAREESRPGQCLECARKLDIYPVTEQDQKREFRWRRQILEDLGATEGKNGIWHIPLAEGEMTDIVLSTGYINSSFGPGGSALIFNWYGPMTDQIRHLGLTRGVLNENLDGAGI